MANDIKKVTENATIDVSMVVVETYDTTPKVYGWKTATKAEVNADIEEQEAIKLIVKRRLIAQKPAEKTLTGNTITLTDALLIMEMLPLCNGGELVYDSEDTTKIVGYRPPVVGEEIVKSKFRLSLYSAIMEGSSVTGYMKVTYPGCEGNPIGLNAEDDVFNVSELEIVSAPGSGERAYEMDIVDELPTISNN
jgi:hypothetical protein